jgi:hypothetical protein
MATFSTVGIKHIAACKKGTLENSPENKVILGTRNNEELNIIDITQDDVRERPMVIKRRFETPMIESRQPSLQHLQAIFSTYRADQGCDLEILAEPQASGVDNGCFQFTGDNYVGVKGMYQMDPEKRILGVQFGVSLEPLTAKALVDASDSATPATLGITTNGIDTAKERYPWPVLSTATFKPASVFDPSELLDYSLLLEELGEDEKLNGRFIGDWIKATLMFKFKNASIAAMVSDMADAAGITISFQQDTSAASATFEKWVFNQYVLRKKVERKIEAKERYIMQTYTGKFPKANLAFSFTALNGGGTSANGTEGGTVTVSL